ncbi:MAG: YeeE/YedE family protein [Myxococcales bacterium]|nr:YeeE/YedE family protein [Myxococcales bacterium]
MEDLFWLRPLLGGALIGLAAAALMFFHGRIAGISGIVGGALAGNRGDLSWRLLFALGLVAGGVLMLALDPASFAVTLKRPAWAIVAAGLLVGFGTRLGSGCTSGHGVCGIGRFSPRSIVATVTFVASGAITVFVSRFIFGGA